MLLEARLCTRKGSDYVARGLEQESRRQQAGVRWWVDGNWFNARRSCVCEKGLCYAAARVGLVE
jgi:hypothetical protein